MISFIPATETKSTSFDLGPQDYLNHFFSLICTLRGGRRRYLPLLLTKVAQTLPTMIQPISQHLSLEPMAALQTPTEALSSSLVSTSANVTDSEEPPDKENGTRTAKLSKAHKKWLLDDLNYADISRIGDKTPEIATAFLQYSSF